MSAKTIVEKYHQAVGKRDFGAVRTLLADDLDFQGPIAKHDNADDLIKDLQGLAKIAEGTVDKKTFVDGDDVCSIYDLKTKVGVAPVAEWFHIEDGKIKSMRVFFDARPFAPQK